MVDDSAGRLCISAMGERGETMYRMERVRDDGGLLAVVGLRACVHAGCLY